MRVVETEKTRKKEIVRAPFGGQDGTCDSFEQTSTQEGIRRSPTLAIVHQTVRDLTVCRTSPGHCDPHNSA